MKHPGMINSIANEGEDLFEWSGDNFLQAKKIYFHPPILLLYFTLSPLSIPPGLVGGLKVPPWSDTPFMTLEL